VRGRRPRLPVISNAFDKSNAYPDRKNKPPLIPPYQGGQATGSGEMKTNGERNKTGTACPDKGELEGGLTFGNWGQARARRSVGA